MKFFKSVRTWIATALCALMCVTGGLAVNELTNKKAIAAGTETTYSEDVQKVLDAFNDLRGRTGGKDKTVTAEYVKDYVLNDGVTKTSGILVSTDNTNGTNETEPIVYPNIKINYGALKVGPSHASAVGFVALADNKGTADITRFSPHFFNSDGTAGFAFVLNKNDASTVKVGGVRVLSTDSYAGYQGLYYHSYRDYTYYLSDNATRGNAEKNIIYSFSEGFNKPFDVWYENSTNLLYATPSNSHTQKDKTYIAGLLSADPTKLTSYNANYTNPFASVDGVQNFSHNYIGSFKSNLVFNGFDNNEGHIGFRFNALAGHKSSFIVTSYAGLDLTNPLSTFDSEVLVADDSVGAAASYTIPAPKYVNTISETTATAFDGTVNVYAGERSITTPYTALGALVTKADDLGEAIVTGKLVGDTITLPEVGMYTLEYVDANGQVAYSTLDARASAAITLDNVNTTVYKNGALLNNGELVIPGDVLKFVPNEGYDLYNFYASDVFGGDANDYVVINDKLTRITTEDEYVVTDSNISTGAISIISAAFSNKYTISINRLGSGVYDTNLSLFEGIDCKYYRFTEPNRWKLNQITIGSKETARKVAGYYAVLHYDGEKVYMNAPITATGYSHPANHELAGYTLKNTDTGEYLGLLKTGVDHPNAFPVHSNVTVTSFTRESKVLPSVIKTEGTVGLTVQFLIDKASYDLMLEAHVKYDSKNGLGYQGTAKQALYAIVIPERHIAEFNKYVPAGDQFKDPYRYYACATNNAYKEALAGMWQRVEITNFGEDVVIDGATYVSFNVTIRNIKLENYNTGFYVGAYFDTGSCNGGDVYRLGTVTKTSFNCYNVLETAKVNYSGISNQPSEEATMVEINGVKYYSEVHTASQIKTLVKFYNYGMYLSNVTTEATEGYAPYKYLDGTVYYYNTAAINNDSDAERIIKYALEVIG